MRCRHKLADHNSRLHEANCNLLYEGGHRIIRFGKSNNYQETEIRRLQPQKHLTMKTTEIKCALTALFLSLSALPLDAVAESISGIWKLDAGANASTINYKVLKRDGTYYNLRSQDGGKSYFVTRSGNYKVVPPGVYVENLKYEYGHQCNTVFPISYKQMCPIGLRHGINKGKNSQTERQ